MPNSLQMDSLATLLGSAPKVSAPNRNPAHAAALEHLLGITPSPYGFSSEADLQSAADEQRAADLEKVLAPERLKTQGALALQSQTGQSALDLERQKEQGAQELANTESKNSRDSLAAITGTAVGAGEGANPSATGNGAYDIHPTINDKGGMSIGMTPSKPAQQIEAQMHAAAAGASRIPFTRAMLDELDKQGAIGPFTSRVESGAAATGLDPLTEYLGLTPKGSSQAFNAFKTQLSLTKSNLAYAHGAARGGSSPAMQARFDELFNPNQSPAALRGALDTAEQWLRMYSSAKTPEEYNSVHDQLEAGAGGL
jgi:hypothetical protein